MEENLSTTEPLPPLETLVAQLQAELPKLRAQYDVERLSVFGSYARREQRSGSDLDLLVTFHTTPGLFKYIELEQHLSDLLGVRVDLVMERSLKPAIRERVEKDVLPV